MKLIDRGHAVTERQHAKPLAPATEEWIVGDHETAGLQSDNVFNDYIDVGCGARVQNMQSQSESASCRLQICRLNITARASRIDQRGDGARGGEKVVGMCNRFRPSSVSKEATPVKLPPGRRRLVTKPT